MVKLQTWWPQHSTKSLLAKVVVKTKRRNVCVIGEGKPKQGTTMVGTDGEKFWKLEALHPQKWVFQSFIYLFQCYIDLLIIDTCNITILHHAVSNVTAFSLRLLYFGGGVKKYSGPLSYNLGCTPPPTSDTSGSKWLAREETDRTTSIQHGHCLLISLCKKNIMEVDLASKLNWRLSNFYYCEPLLEWRLKISLPNEYAFTILLGL